MKVYDGAKVLRLIMEFFSYLIFIKNSTVKTTCLYIIFNNILIIY
jgi:hypothetical protein